VDNYDVRVKRLIQDHLVRARRSAQGMTNARNARNRENMLFYLRRISAAEETLSAIEDELLEAAGNGSEVALRYLENYYRERGFLE
jgi:hypothetical protein